MGSLRTTPLTRRGRKRRPAVPASAYQGPLRAIARRRPALLASNSQGPLRAVVRRGRKRRPPLLASPSNGPLRAVARRVPIVPAPRKKGPLAAVKRPSWKLVGLAGIAGVAATGVVVARNRRAHRDLPPDELRERLHRRLAEVGADAATEGEATPSA